MSNYKQFKPPTLEDDSNFGDAVFDVHKDNKRHIRVTVKEYPQGGTYIFFKTFKMSEEEGEFVRRQYMAMTKEEFDALYRKMDAIKQATSQSGESGDDEATSDEESPVSSTVVNIPPAKCAKRPLETTKKLIKKKNNKSK